MTYGVTGVVRRCCVARCALHREAMLLHLRRGRSFSNYCDRCLLGRAVPPSRARCTAVRRREPPPLASHVAALTHRHSPSSVRRTAHDTSLLKHEPLPPASPLHASATGPTAGTLQSTTQHSDKELHYRSVAPCRSRDVEQRGAFNIPRTRYDAPPHLSDGDAPRIASACAREVLSCSWEGQVAHHIMNLVLMLMEMMLADFQPGPLHVLAPVAWPAVCAGSRCTDRSLQPTLWKLPEPFRTQPDASRSRARQLH